MPSITATITFACCALLAAASSAQTNFKTPTEPDEAGELPAGARPVDQEITVLLELAGDPVAVARSRAPNKELSDEEEERIASDLRGQQANLTPLIEARGGSVRSQLQHAVNGITVTVRQSQLAALATTPGVVAVKPVVTYEPLNSESVPFIGADATWGGTPGFGGEGKKIFVIDTGIDYTHANFGGPGTPAAYDEAFKHSTEPADPALFGPLAPKVKGGTDLVGDAYNANIPGSMPVPDPNPLDCGGHGSHTAGTAAGFGVTASGKTFHGPYDANTPRQSFLIGPGVAPLADLYSVRVFGCVGSTNVVTEAIDFAVAHHADVISMSLGANFGSEDSADAEASEHAQEAGVIVVAASGNAGNIPYVTSSPASGDKTISVAAMDSHAGFPGAIVALSTRKTVTAIDADGIRVDETKALPVVVLKTSTGAIALGCKPADYTAPGVNAAGKLVVVKRGVCARVARAIYGQMAGAAAVLMVNTDAGLPPFEGPITSNPDTGAPFTVTIPFLGAGSGDGPALLAANGGSALLKNAQLPNPTFRRFASFSSSGARTGDGHLKPDISAPGVSVFSTLVGSGTQGQFESGTSMATPHVAGVAALALQAHPGWDSDEVRKAIVNTADPAQISGYTPRRGGAGLVQPLNATRTAVFATAGRDEASLSFGVAEFTRDFRGEGEIRLTNRGDRDATFTVAAKPVNGSPHKASVSRSRVRVEAGASAAVHVTLEVPSATAGDSSAFREVAGLVTFSPATEDENGGVGLTVPYLLVPRARSLVETEIAEDFGPDQPAAVALVRNESRSVAGSADFYAWNLRGRNSKAGDAGIRAVGVQSFNAGPKLGELVVFAINTFKPWSNPATTVFDVLIDVDGDGKPDFDIETADVGLLLGQGFTGRMASAVFDLNKNTGKIEFNAGVSTDGSTILAVVRAADMGITVKNPRFTYVEVDGVDLTTGKADVLPGGSAGFNVFASSISTAGGDVVAPGASITVPLSIDPAEWARTPALGVMVVGMDNPNHGEEARQAQLLRVSPGGEDRD